MATAKPIHIFKAGTHTDMHGRTIEFTEADLAASASAYDPAIHEAPIVIGHPKSDDPAYGWVNGLSVSEDNLFAEPEQVDESFAEMLHNGRFKKVSASFYMPDSPANPKPGVHYLRHVGFLGAQPPAIKGLKQTSFAEGEEGVIELEFGDFTLETQAGVLRSLREWILGKFGKEDADAAVPNYNIDYLQREAARPSPAEASPATSGFSEPTQEDDMTKEEIAAAQAKLDEQKAAQVAKAAEFAEREQKLIEAEAATHRAECADFVEALVSEGKVLPAQKDGLTEFMAGLDESGTVEFGEGDDAVKQNPVEFLKAYLTAQPKQIEFGEHAGGEDAGNADLADPVVLANKAVEFQESELAAGREISMTEAVDHIKSQGV